MKVVRILPFNKSRKQDALSMSAAPGIDLKANALATVVRWPDDENARQTYAELFPVEEERRRFIVAQLKIARLHSDNENADCFSATLETSRLLDLNYEKWRPDWSEHVDKYVKEYEFYRGFVELVKISGYGLLAADSELFQRAPIRHLDLTDTASLWNHLSDHSNLQNIISISLNNNKLRDDDIAFLVKSPYLKELKWLTLVNNRDISMFGVQLIAENYHSNLPNLEYVSFQGAGFNPVEQYAADEDVITETWLPPEGKELEARFGPLPWLRRHATKRSQIPPLRFAISGKSGFDRGTNTNSYNECPSCLSVLESE